MAKKQWTVRVDGTTHNIEFEHGAWTGKWKLIRDGQVIREGKKNLTLGGDFPFMINDHVAMVTARSNGFALTYDLVVDNQSTTTGQHVASLSATPAWAWLFAVACGIIPIFTLGGALPAVIGFGAASLCLTTARNTSMPIAGRVAACIGITIAAWVLVFLVVGGLFMLFR